MIAARPPMARVSVAPWSFDSSETWALYVPIIKKARAVKKIDKLNWIGCRGLINRASTNGSKGINPINEKAKKVAKAVFLGFFLCGCGCECFDLI